MIADEGVPESRSSFSLACDDLCAAHFVIRCSAWPVHIVRALFWSHSGANQLHHSSSAEATSAIQFDHVGQSFGYGWSVVAFAFLFLLQPSFFLNLPISLASTFPLVCMHLLRTAQRFLLRPALLLPTHSEQQLSAVLEASFLLLVALDGN